MAQNKDLCPNTNGEHRYFVFKTQEVFVPFKLDVSILEQALIPKLPAELYVKKEYAILGCNCGSVIKTEVEQR